MCWQDQQSRTIHIDEGHHDHLIRKDFSGESAGRGSSIGRAAAFVAIVQRSFVAMVSIRNNQLLVLHLAADKPKQARIRNLGHSVPHVVFVADFNIWRCSCREQTVNLSGGIAIEHEDLAKVRARRPQQIQLTELLEIMLRETATTTNNNNNNRRPTMSQLFFTDPAFEFETRNILGQVHYGWARLSVTPTENERAEITAVLTGYAYETIPNKPIVTGKTKGPDVTTLPPAKLESATLGQLARGASQIPPWRRLNAQTKANGNLR